MNSKETIEAEFDAFALDYDAQLQKGLSVTGENKEYFAERRIEWLISRIKKYNVSLPKKILDFGCGDGGSIPFLNRAFQPDKMIGVDVSRKSLEVARQKYPFQNVKFHAIEDFRPKAEFQMAFCNGVFHHIPPAERRKAVEYVFEALQANGIFAFWENNPWNPGTRYVMSRTAFDKDAIVLSFLESKSLLSNAGFEILESNFLFFFPNMLRQLRFLEPYLSGVPVGGQYMVLGRKRK